MCKTIRKSLKSSRYIKIRRTCKKTPEMESLFKNAYPSSFQIPIHSAFILIQLHSNLLNTRKSQSQKNKFLNG